MTFPGNWTSSGKEEMEHGALERDQFLELKINQHQLFFFSIFNSSPTLVAEMHVLYTLFLTGCTCLDYSQA